MKRKMATLGISAGKLSSICPMCQRSGLNLSGIFNQSSSQFRISPKSSLASSASTIHRHRRPFSTTRPTCLRSSELTSSQFASLRANPDRLWSDIHGTARWGQGTRYGDGPEQTGISRLTLTDADAAVRRWFVDTVTELGCQVTVDRLGNTFAMRPGRHHAANVPATFAGSHLDTQPTGGRFDGVLGVCAGVEMLRVLQENWVETEGDVGVVNWTNEEGARFSRSMMGSGVWCGRLELEDIYALKEVGVENGKARTVKEELERIGALGDVPCHWRDGFRLGAHFELHIEQGPFLVNAGEKVGVVQGGQAYRWYTVNVTGRDCHTGTTAFQHRADALYWAAKAIQMVRPLAEKHGGLASVGIIKTEPGSVNTVPGRVMFSLDIRHPETEKVDAIESEVRNYLDSIQQESHSPGAPGIKVDVIEDFRNDATKFDPDAVGCVAEAGKSVLGLRDGEVRRMTSGAGHDTVFTSMRCPSAMIFAACRDGISHHPEEWCEKEDCAAGASVLTEAVLRFDKLRYERGDFT